MQEGRKECLQKDPSQAVLHTRRRDVGATLSGGSLKAERCHRWVPSHGYGW